MGLSKCCICDLSYFPQDLSHTVKCSLNGPIKTVLTVTTASTYSFPGGCSPEQVSGVFNTAEQFVGIFRNSNIHISILPPQTTVHFPERWNSMQACWELHAVKYTYKFLTIKPFLMGLVLKSDTPFDNILQKLSHHPEHWCLTLWGKIKEGQSRVKLTAAE